jgi:hypothetical protein
MHVDAYVEPGSRPKWDQTTLQDAWDIFWDQVDTRRT